LIHDCSNVDLSKINQNNMTIVSVLHSTSKRINPLNYDKILIRIEPYVSSLLYKSKLFDSKLRKEFEKLIDQKYMEGMYEFLLIHNKDLSINKYSKL